MNSHAHDRAGGVPMSIVREAKRLGANVFEVAPTPGGYVARIRHQIGRAHQWTLSDPQPLPERAAREALARMRHATKGKGRRR